MKNQFDDIAGVLDIPSFDNFDESTIEKDGLYFEVRNASQPLEDKKNIALDGISRESGVSNQDFLYMMQDFANRHGQEIIVAKEDSLIMTGAADIIDKFKTEFKQQQFFCEYKYPELLEEFFRVIRIAEKAIKEKSAQPQELVMYS